MKKVIIVVIVSILVLVGALVAILTGAIGGTGYMVNEEANKTVDDTTKQMDNLAVQTFNMNITPYISKNRSVSDIKQLYASILYANEIRNIEVLLNDKKFDQSDLKEGSRYDVTAEYDKQGYINKVLIEESQIMEDMDDDNIPLNWIYTIRNVALNTYCNKIYIYKDGTYIIEKGFWNDLESNILSKGYISNLGNMNDLLSKLEKDSKEHQDDEYGYEIIKWDNTKMYVSINNETLQSILSATKYNGGVLHD